MTGCKGFKRLEGFEAFKGWKTAGLDAHKKTLMCGLGVPVGCRMKHAKGMFKAWQTAGLDPHDGL